MPVSLEISRQDSLCLHSHCRHEPLSTTREEQTHHWVHANLPLLTYITALIKGHLLSLSCGILLQLFTANSNVIQSSSSLLNPTIRTALLKTKWAQAMKWGQLFTTSHATSTYLHC